MKGERKDNKEKEKKQINLTIVMQYTFFPRKNI